MEEISVLIPTYNRGHLIEETIKSVFNQTFQNFEIIIIDDGSTDNTETLVKSIDDQRIRYYKYEHSGKLAKLRNIAVSKSLKPFVAFIDSDDLWHPEKLQKCLYSCVNNGYEICVTDSIEFTGDHFKKKSNGHRLIHKSNIDIKREILINNEALCTNMFFHRKIHDRINGFDESLFHSDHDFICRALYSSKSIYIPEVLSFMRRHQENMSLNENNLDQSALEEYNLTLKKILATGGITKKDFFSVTSNNYYQMAGFAIDNGLFKLSFSYLFHALKFKFQFKKTLGHFKRLIKYILRLNK